MQERSAILILAVAVSFYFMYRSLNAIDKYASHIPMNKATRHFLIWISIIAPVIGFLLTRRMEKRIVQ